MVCARHHYYCLHFKIKIQTKETPYLAHSKVDQITVALFSCLMFCDLIGGQ